MSHYDVTLVLKKLRTQVYGLVLYFKRFEEKIDIQKIRVGIPQVCLYLTDSKRVDFFSLSVKVSYILFWGPVF